MTNEEHHRDTSGGRRSYERIDDCGNASAWTQGGRMSHRISAAGPATIQQSPPPDLPIRVGRNAFVLWLDAFLLLFFLVALTPSLTSLAIHEIVGIAFCIVLLAHLLIAWQWIKAGARKLFMLGSYRIRVNYLLNVLLFVITCVLIATGLVISQVVLPAAGIPSVNDGNWVQLHNLMAYCVYFVLGIHIAMNWQWIVAAIRRHALSLSGRRVDAQAGLAAPSAPLDEDAGE